MATLIKIAIFALYAILIMATSNKPNNLFTTVLMLLFITLMIVAIMRLFAQKKILYSCPNCGNDIEPNESNCHTCKAKLEL